MNGQREGGRRHPAHPAPVLRVNHPAIVFLTMCVKGKRPLLARDSVHALLLRAWHIADRWLVGRYVIMPDHVHLFCAPADREWRLGDWINYWRNHVTRAWPNQHDKPIWQRDYWDTQLRRGENYSSKWDYARNNPVRANLVARAEDWPCSGEMNTLWW